MQTYNLTHLKELESEAIYVVREVASQFENPVLLFSGGKDSIVCAHIAKKAFLHVSIYDNAITELFSNNEVKCRIYEMWGKYVPVLT